MLSFSHSFFSLSCTLQGAGGVGGLLAVVRDDGGFAPTYDANGNVSEHIQLSTVQTDNYPSLPIAGGIVAHYEYSPFGEVTAQSGGLADAFTFRFSTKYFENETGIVHYERRPNLPSLGCWMSRDPIEERGGLNLYGFAGNNPVNNIDNLGLMKVCCRSVESDKWLEREFRHCEMAKSDSCGEGETSYSVTIDNSANRKMMVDGTEKTCNCVTQENIKKCMDEHGYPWTATEVKNACGLLGNNCQASVINQLANCCLRSTWRPNWHAGDARGKCLKIRLVPPSGMLYCDEWEYPEWRD